MFFRELIESALSPERALSFAADFRTLPEWDDSVTSVAGTKRGRITVGANYDVEIKFLGSRSRLRYRVTEYEPGRRAVLVGTNFFVTATDIVSVEATESGSSLTWEAEINLSGILGLVEPLLADMFRARVRRSAQGLRKALAKLQQPSSGAAAGKLRPHEPVPAPSRRRRLPARKPVVRT